MIIKIVTVIKVTLFLICLICMLLVGAVYHNYIITVTSGLVSLGEQGVPQENKLTRGSKCYFLGRVKNAIAEVYPAIVQDTGSTMFQFTASPMNATWTNGNDIEAYNMANRVSADDYGYYTPSPGSLYQDYLSFIISISGGENYENDPLYQLLISQKDIAEKSYQDALRQLAIVWEVYKKQGNKTEDGTPELTYEEWQDSPVGGLQYYTNVQHYEGKKKSLSGRIARVIKPFNAALAEAQFQVTADRNQSNYKKKDGTEVRLPTITIEGNLGEDLTNWSAQSDTYDLDVTLDSSSQYQTSFEQRCLSMSAREKSNSVIIAQDKKYKIRVMFKGIKAYPVTFGNWYTSSFVNPKTAKFSPATVVNVETFFAAKNGSLHMIPSLIWVMYQPKVELTVSTELYRQKMEGVYHSGLGWFSIPSLNVAVDEDLTKVGEQTTTITFVSPPLQGPQVLGVTSLKKIL